MRYPWYYTHMTRSLTGVHCVKQITHYVGYDIFISLYPEMQGTFGY